MFNSAAPGNADLSLQAQKTLEATTLFLHASLCCMVLSLYDYP
jgi:hypothetical protein